MIYIKGTYFAEIRTNTHFLNDEGNKQNLQYGEEARQFNSIQFIWKINFHRVATLSFTYPAISHIPASTMWQ